MNNGTSGLGVLFTDGDDAWGGGTLANRQTIAVDAQYGAAQTWGYYADVHGRNGIRDDGVGALSRVHYSVNYDNAFWNDSCFCMTYGDGDGVDLYPLASLDVAGHEMSHGVTSATSNRASVLALTTPTSTPTTAFYFGVPTIDTKRTGIVFAAVTTDDVSVRLTGPTDSPSFWRHV